MSLPDHIDMGTAKNTFVSFLLVSFLGTLTPRDVHAGTTGKKPPESRETTESSSPSASPSAGPEEADVKKIQEKYWARGDETEVGVVQNRLFTNHQKFELGLTLASVAGDPFLTDTSLAASIGYHFTELVSAHIEFAKTFVGPSSALETLQQQLSTTANTNEPKFYTTAEARGSLLYGKVSLLGTSILYFDAYVTGGLGYISTESGGNPLLTAGVGQLFHLNQTFGIHVAYKLLWYQETILGKVGGANGNLGQNLGRHNNLSNAIMVGVSIFLDPIPEQKVVPKSSTSTSH
jgi:outer membrane beta-barrel protein